MEEEPRDSNLKILFVGGFNSGAWLLDFFGNVGKITPDICWNVPSYTDDKDIKQEVFTLDNKILTPSDFLPHNFLKAYRKTRNDCQSYELIGELKPVVEEFQPDVIFCHSLGCLLFIACLDNGLNISSQTKVIFSHADVSAKMLGKINGLGNIYNFYSPWDFALWVSAIVNCKLPLGLKNKIVGSIKNVRLKNRRHNVLPDIGQKIEYVLSGSHSGDCR